MPLESARVSVAPANPAVNKAGVEGPELLTPPTRLSRRPQTRSSERVREWTSGSSRSRWAHCSPPGIGASLLAGRLRLPGLVLVLVLGMVDRLRRPGLDQLRRPSDYDAAQAAAIIALALILYEGGLSSGWAEIRPVIGVSIALATRRARCSPRG